MKLTCSILFPLLIGILSLSLPAQTVSLVAVDSSISETFPGQPANPGRIRITRTGATTAAVTVWLKITGIAVRATDYMLVPNAASFATIPAGSAQLEMDINPIDDWLTEGTETLRIELDGETASGTPVPYPIGNDRLNLNILDNEDPLQPLRVIVTAGVIDAVGTEVGTDTAMFRITRSNNLTVPVTVNYTIGGTATSGADFTPPPTSVTFAAGVTFVDVPIVPVNDPLVEPNETVTLTLTPHPSALNVPYPADSYVLGSFTNASVTIVSEDLPPPPTVTITSPTNGTTQTAPAANPISVPISFTASDVNGHIASYKIYDGGRLLVNTTTGYPTPPAPGTPFNGTFTMANAYGGTHNLRVVVTDNSGVNSQSPIVAVTTTYIYPVMTVTAEDANAAEVADGGVQNPAVFAITVDTAMPIDQYVYYRLTSPGPGLDFVIPPNYALTNWPMYIFSGPSDYGWALFPAGSTRAEIVVTPVDDLHLEGTETVTIELSYPFVIDERTFEGIVQFTEGGFYVDPNAIPVRNFQYDIAPVRTATATIADNDTVPAPFSIVTLAVTDGDAQETAPGVTVNPGVFTVTRDGPTGLPLTVNFAITTPPRPTVITNRVANATNGVDFTAIGTSVTIPAGASTADIVIAPLYDLLAEPLENIQISLLPPTIPLPDPASYMLGAATTTNLSIKDATLAPGTPVIRISAFDSQAYESVAPSRSAAFSIARAGDTTGPLTVHYAINGSATNGVDYTTITSSVVIPAGVLSALVTINPIDDTFDEGIEGVALTLLPPPVVTDPPAYVLGASTTAQNTAGITIRDIYVAPLNRFERARRLRFPGRYAVIARPRDPDPVPAAAIAVATASTPAVIGQIVEASSDLVNWEQIGTIEPTEDVDEFVDVNAENFPTRFYRFRPIYDAPPQ